MKDKIHLENDEYVTNQRKKKTKINPLRRTDRVVSVWKAEKVVFSTELEECTHAFCC